MKTRESCPEGAWQIALTEVLMRALPWTMLLGMGTILTAAPAQAQMYDPRYPVCMQVYSRDGSFIGCGYTSMAQCAATASGRAAQCFANPYFARTNKKASRRALVLSRIAKR
jgi:hypothetical protein